MPQVFRVMFVVSCERSLVSQPYFGFTLRHLQACSQYYEMFFLARVGLFLFRGVSSWSVDCRNRFELALLIQSILMILAQVCLSKSLNKLQFDSGYSLRFYISVSYIDLASVQRYSLAQCDHSLFGNGKHIHNISNSWPLWCISFVSLNSECQLIATLAYVKQYCSSFSAAPRFLLPSSGFSPLVWKVHFPFHNLSGGYLLFSSWKAGHKEEPILAIIDSAHCMDSGCRHCLDGLGVMHSSWEFLGFFQTHFNHLSFQDGLLFSSTFTAAIQGLRCFSAYHRLR